MNKNQLYDYFLSILNEDSVSIDVPMKEHTTMRVGGNADLMILPGSMEAVQRCILFLSQNNVPYLLMGNGSNLIFPDEGYRGVILKVASKLSKIEVNEDCITAEGGALLSAVANRALEQSLSGLEFASGIPGSIGGAVFMNAGAYDGEMKQVVQETICIDRKGNIVTLTGDEHNFSYRHSRLQDEGLACIKVKLKLKTGNYNSIREKMRELNARRKEKQPLNLPSSGSIFKRPPGHFAGKLIEDCGLKGFAIGGAQVSDKHCGFIVNTGTAKSADVVNLIRYVQKTIYEKTGVFLDTEVRIIGGT